MAVYRGKEDVDIPELDLLTYLFDSSFSASSENSILHLDAADPSILYNKASARVFTKRFAHTLRSQFGIGSQAPAKDVVTVISSGQAYLPIAFYGVIAAGGVYSAASTSFKPSELARQIKDGDSSVLICSKDAVKVAVEAAEAAEVPLDRVLVLESSPAWRLYRIEDKNAKSIISYEQLDWERITDLETLKNRPVTLLYSSGTTGIPKGVPLTSYNIVSAATFPAIHMRRYNEKRRAEGNPIFEYRTLAHLPTAHVAGCQGYFVNPVIMGGPVFWMPNFDFAKFLYYNKVFRITTFFTVPPIYLLIAKSPLVTDQFKSLEFCISGAAPMGPELQRQASEKLSMGRNVWITQTWGLSETCGSATLMPMGEKDYTGSVSPLLYNSQMKLVDENGETVSEGEEGEILLKGPNIFNGYHNRNSATEESFRDGWFCTGDIGLVKNDLLYVVDRKKELIKYKGLQVAPAELEALLISHPDIADAAVIGVPWQETEAPRAYVVANKSKISDQQIKDFVYKNASSHKQLRGGVIYLDAIPKSASGKILRKDLRDMAKREATAKL